MEKSFIEMQLVYLIEIFEDNYKTVRDRFETDSVNLIKNRLIVAKKRKGSFNILTILNILNILTILTQSYQKTLEIVTRSNNTENVRKPYWFVTNS